MLYCLGSSHLHREKHGSSSCRPEVSRRKEGTIFSLQSFLSHSLVLGQALGTRKAHVQTSLQRCAEAPSRQTWKDTVIVEIHSIVCPPLHTCPPFPSSSLSVSQCWEAAIRAGDGRQLGGRCFLSSSLRGILQIAIISWFPPFKPVLHRPQKCPSGDVSRAFHSNYAPGQGRMSFLNPEPSWDQLPKLGTNSPVIY